MIVKIDMQSWHIVILLMIHYYVNSSVMLQLEEVELISTTLYIIQSVVENNYVSEVLFLLHYTSTPLHFREKCCTWSVYKMMYCYRFDQPKVYKVVKLASLQPATTNLACMFIQHYNNPIILYHCWLYSTIIFDSLRTVCW